MAGDGVYRIVLRAEANNRSTRLCLKGDVSLSSENKPASDKKKREEGAKFKSKHIRHDPSAESARAVFGLKSGIGDADHSGND